MTQLIIQIYISKKLIYTINHAQLQQNMSNIFHQNIKPNHASLCLGNIGDFMSDSNSIQLIPQSTLNQHPQSFPTHPMNQKTKITKNLGL